MLRRLIIMSTMFALPFYFGRIALAGPPFLTDDPEPVELGHHEFYLFSTLDKATDSTQVQAPAFEYNYGIAHQTQFHILFPFTSFNTDDDPTAYGPGDLELGVKYRFIQETETFPQVGTFPLLEVATGDSGRGLGNGRTWAKIPIWIQKSWGPWTTYGGGGYAVNPEPGQRDYPFAGWLLQRDLSEQWTLGGEIFTQGKTADDGQDTTFVNLGGFYNFTKNFSLLFTAGNNISGENHLICYLGLYWTW
jgi:PPE-repeat protein